jgi:hypothetical protein
VSVIAGALPVLKEKSIRFAMETEHRVHGEYTSVAITRLLSGIGYNVLSSSQFGGQQFTWAQPEPIGISSSPAAG